MIGREVWSATPNHTNQITKLVLGTTIRVIRCLGTLTQATFLGKVAKRYGEKIASQEFSKEFLSLPKRKFVMLYCCDLTLQFLKLKMIVETAQMQKCGQGTPMFSRRGKSTSVLYPVFNNPSPDDRDSKDDFAGKKITQNELKAIFEKYSRITQASFDHSPKNGQSSGQSRAHHKHRQKHSSHIFKMISRENSPLYKLAKQAVALNDGRYNINFSAVEKHSAIADFTEKEPLTILTPIIRQPQCLAANGECTIQTRIIQRRKAQEMKHGLELSQAISVNSLPSQFMKPNSPEKQTQERVEQRNSRVDINLLSLNGIQRVSTNLNPDFVVSSKDEKKRKQLVSQDKKIPMKVIVREQASLLDAYERIQRHVASPIKFERQQDRKDFNKGYNAHDERFECINRMPLIFTKFKRAPIVEFEKYTGKPPLENLLGVSKDCENARNQVYKPNYQYISKAPVVPSFKHSLPREVGTANTKYSNDIADSDKVVAGFDKLSDHPRICTYVSFNKLTGRSTSTSATNQSSSVLTKKGSITFSDFLPNSMKSSPKSKEFSHSFITDKMGLRRHMSQRDDIELNASHENFTSHVAAL